MKIDKIQFGKTIDGIDVEQYIMSNNKGMEISIIDYGGIITSWTAACSRNNIKVTEQFLVRFPLIDP